MSKDKNMVTITCYGRTQTMPRAEAIAKYHEYIFCAEGSEQRTYVDIYGQLLSGSTNISDEPYKVIRY